MKTRPKFDPFAPGWVPPKEAMEFSISGEFENVGPKRFIVEGLVAEGEFSVVYGEPAFGKGNFVTTLACAAAGGQTFFGRQAGWINRGEWNPCGVLYLALERHHQVQRRITAYELEHGAPYHLPIAVCSQQFDIRSDDAASLIVETLYDAHDSTHMRLEGGPGPCKFKPDYNLIIIDTLAMALQGGNDANPEDLGAVVKTCRRVIAETGAHVMLIHHSPVGGDNRMRGHGTLNAAIDLSIQVDSRREGRVAKVRKNSDGPAKIADFHFGLKSFDVPQWYPDQYGERDETQGCFYTPAAVLVEMDAPAVKSPLKPEVVDAPPTASKSEQPVLDALAGIGRPATDDEWRAAFDDHRDSGISNSAHRKRFSVGKPKLEAKGLISKDENNMWSVTALP